MTTYYQYSPVKAIGDHSYMPLIIALSRDRESFVVESKYVFLPSKAEGIGLPMIEALICGSIPITCSDNLTAKEFSPQDFICEPNSNAIADKIKKLESEYDSKRKIALELGKKYKVKFDKKTIAKNIIDIFDAR